MGSMHKISTIDQVLLPLGVNMTNGSSILEDGEDCLEDIALAINNLFNWFNPTVVFDQQPTNPWTCSDGAGVVTLAEYIVPAWSVGLGSQPFVAYVEAETTGSAVGSAHVYVREVSIGSATGFSGSATEKTISGGSSAPTGYEIMKVELRGEVTAGTGSLKINKFRLEYDTQSTNLPDGPYGGSFGNDFLPNDTDHFGTPYHAGSVERIRRMLVGVMELIRRRTPQPIVTWSNLANSFGAGGAKSQGQHLLCRLLTRQLPYCDHVVVYASYYSVEHIRIRIGNKFADLPGTAGSHSTWRRIEIPVNVIEELSIPTKEFRVYDMDSSGRAEIYSLTAYWGILR